MYIESDLPSGVINPDVSVEVTTEDGRHAQTPLDYETWNSDENTGETKVKAYDAAGSSVVLTLKNKLIMEMAYGRIAEEGADPTRETR
jgi:hypothetical protein